MSKFAPEQVIQSLNFPQNPSFMAALNRSRTVGPMSANRTVIETKPPVVRTTIATTPAIYGMQRNMFERAHISNGGCSSCRGNK